MNNTSSSLFAFAAATALFVVPSFADREEAWQSRPVVQDTFVRDTETDTNFGSITGVLAGNWREGLMMFDVSGLANIAAAKIKFYITQCGTTEGVKWPLYFRVMRNDRWNESTVTWNMLPDEFRVPAPVLATNDVTMAGYVEVPAGSLHTWQEVDVTEAVKAAAPRGRLALHVYTYWDGITGDTTPLCFASSEYADVEKCPRLEFQGTVDTSASSLTLLPTDDVFIEAGHPNVNYGVSNAGNGGERYFSVLAQRNNREGFLKFDLSGIGAERVDSAVLLMRMNKNQANHMAGNMVQFQLMEKTDWSEAEVTWNNAATTTGVSPASGWPEETPTNAVRVDSANTNVFHTVELAPLVNQVLASGKTTLSLHVKMRSDWPTYFIFYSKESSDERNWPRLLVTPKVDAPVTTRRPLQQTTMSSFSSAMMDTACYDYEYVQIGCNVNSVVLYGLMLFDPSKLEDAEFVRLRVMGKNSFYAGAGALRVTAYLTDAWNETNLTWNTAFPWFPKPGSVVDGVALGNEIANIGLIQNKQSPYFEVDVTAAARAAAQAGRMLTVGLFSNSRDWEYCWNGKSANPVVLIFPDPDATFGNKVTCSLDMGSGQPALRLDWSPSDAEGATYTVERQKGGAWKTVATGLLDPTCLDPNAEPYVEHTYRITETTTGESVTKPVTLVPTVKVFACADTYVRNGTGSANTSFGTDTTMVHKYSGGNNDGATREGFYRFNLAEMPAKFVSATLKLYPTGPTDGTYTGARFDVFKYPDFEWTDATAPAWNDVFGDGLATPLARSNGSDPKRTAETLLGSYSCDVSGTLQPDVPLCFDLTDAIRAAKAAGESYITLHSATAGGNNWNFGIIPHERAQGVSQAAQIVFTLKNWTVSGTVIMFR